MKPFLLLSHRAVDLAADGEYEAMLRFCGLQPDQLHRVRMEQGPWTPIRLDDWSGIILGGGPFNASDEVKDDVQVRVEAALDELLDEVVARDFPFLGACYGIGVLGTHQRGIVDRTHGEPVGPTTVTLTEAGRRDQLLGGLPEEFDALLGHKEAIHTLPEGAVNLAYSSACPVQAFRVGRNVYATQFHPELDVDGIRTRIDVYRHAGYFDPADATALKELAATREIIHPQRILRRFVELFTQEIGPA